MKKYLLLLSILLINISTQGQTFAPVGAKWTYSESFAFSSQVDTFVLRSVDTILFMGKTCSVIKKSADVCDFRSQLEYMYSDSGKVYFYDNYVNDFQMLYDINAKIGDSWMIYLPLFFNHNGTNDSILTSVDSISFTTINSHILKKLFVHYNTHQGWGPWGSGEIIENIGDTYYLFPWIWGACDWTYAGPLRCYSDSVIGFYDFSTAPNCNYTFTGIEEVEKIKTITLYPNPAKLSLNIHVETDAFKKFNVFNSYGQLVQTGLFSRKTATLNTSNYESGIYYIVVDGNKQHRSAKFMVEK